MSLTKDQIRMIEEPLQDISNMADPLEPIKIVSALRSQCMVLEYRKKNKPKDISPLDYAIIAALWKQVPTKPKRDENNRCICPDCGYIVGYEMADGETLQGYCERCGQRIFWGEIPEADEEAEGEED